MVEEWVEANQLKPRHIGERFTWQNRLTGRLAGFDSTDSGLVSVRLDADDFEWRIPAHHRVKIE